MQFMNIKENFVATICVGVILLSAAIMGQPIKSMNADTIKTPEHVKYLKPQTTCPVTGDPIDKNQYVDYIVQSAYDPGILENRDIQFYRLFSLIIEP